MCGIAGYFSPLAPVVVAAVEPVLEEMGRRLDSRGPDDAGRLATGDFGASFRRLAIIDLSGNANQPMCSPDNRFSLVFNGEIYNYQALRAELSALGHSFRTRGDTEVILNGFRQWGEGVFRRLEGMFALALHDHAERRLVLARDRAGEKPLFFAFSQDGRRLVFASEIKSLLAWPEIDRSLSSPAIDRYLAFQYVPGPETAFQAIRHVEPACFMVVDADLSCRTRRYWSPPASDEPRRAPAADLPSLVRRQLREAVKRQLVADVPVAVMLSGGLDSSAILYCMHDLGVGDIASYTIGFRESSLDETVRARRVARHFGTHHTEVMADEDLVATIGHLASRLDQPFADPAIVAVSSLSRSISARHKVALVGDGGDEALLGYARYIGCKLASGLDWVPPAIGRRLAALPPALGMDRSPVRLIRYASRLIVELSRSEAERYADWTWVFSDTDAAELYTPALLADATRPAVADIARLLNGAAAPDERAALYDFQRYLPYCLLFKTDIASMGYGLEVRAPFLDRAFLELAQSIPPKQRMVLLHSKWLLRAALEDRLPLDVIDADKRGLSVPVDRWLRTSLRDMVEDCLSPDVVRRRGLFRPDAIARMLDRFRAGSGDDKYRIWSLLWLELWQREFADPSAAAACRATVAP